MGAKDKARALGAMMVCAASAASAQQQSPQPGLGEPVPSSASTLTRSDGRFSGGVNATVTISDNIDLTDDNERSGAILEVGPYVRYSVDRPRLQADLSYGLRYFKTSGELGTNGLRHDVNGRLKTALWKDSFWLSSRALVAEVVRNPVTAGTVDAARQNGERSTIQRYALAPYFTGYLKDRYTSYVAGYGASYSKNSSRADGQITHKAIGNVTRDTRQRGFGWLLESEFSTSAFESSDANYDTSRLTAEALIRPDARLRAGLGVEYNKITAVNNEAGEDSGWAPTVSLLWTPNRRTNLNARYSRPYFGSTGAAEFTYESGRWDLGAQFAYGLTDNSTGALGGAKIDNSLASGARSGGEARVVSELLAEEDIPDFVASDTDTFVAGAISRTRRLNLIARWTGRRSNFAIIASRSRVESQNLAIDLPVTPGAPDGFTQTGLSFIVGRRLDPRTSLQARLSRTVSTSNDTSTESQLDVAMLTWLRQIGKKTDLSASYRFAEQQARLGQANRYREQAIVLGLNYRF